MSQQAFLDSRDTFLDIGIPPRIFFFSENFPCVGLEAAGPVQALTSWDAS